MIFSSLAFYIFFAVVLLVTFLLRSNRQKKLFLLAASYYFYGYWDWRFLGLILFSTIVDFLAGGYLLNHPNGTHRKRVLAISLATNLGLLGFFKYFNFFVDSANEILSGFGVGVSNLDIILPVGISFYTFQTMSYSIDVYFGKIKNKPAFIDFALFVAFFPQLVAGPIVRAADFLPQLNHPIALKRENLSTGAKCFLLGLVKKVLIADRMAMFVDPGFHNYQVWSSGTLWLIMIAYAIQIYCDFSGYSDMAIGAARMLGFDLGINFRMPYVSTNITEFWRRWHISLSTWLRDYLYIPLGGNRKGRRRTYINLMTTMTLGGLWHGASWNFVMWGILHGIALVLHKLKMEIWGKGPLLPGKIGAVIGWTGTFVFVLCTWVFFRSPDFSQSLLMISGMFGLNNFGFLEWYFTPLVLIVLPLVIFSHYLGEYRHVHIQDLSFERVPHLALAFLALLCVYYFSPLGVTPFIYFQF
ncbi:MBOAT family protein [bacterium]|nr:MBOAT family protein [bacterium]